MKKPKLLMCRVSSPDHPIDQSLKTQEELIKQYAETHSILIVERWADNTKNGENK